MEDGKCSKHPMKMHSTGASRRLPTHLAALGAPHPTFSNRIFGRAGFEDQARVFLLGREGWPVFSFIFGIPPKRSLRGVPGEKASSRLERPTTLEEGAALQRRRAWMAIVASGFEGRRAIAVHSSEPQRIHSTGTLSLVPPNRRQRRRARESRAGRK